MDARLLSLNIPVTDENVGRRFYSTLLGAPLARSLTNQRVDHHAVVSAGVHVSLSGPYLDGQPMMAQFAVRDLDAMLATLERLGAKVWKRNLELRIERQFRATLAENWKRHYGKDVGDSMGRAAIIADPFGNLIGLVQLQEWAYEPFRAGRISEKDLQIHDVAMAVSRDFFADDEANYDAYERDAAERDQAEIATSTSDGGRAPGVKKAGNGGGRRPITSSPPPAISSHDEVIGPRTYSAPVARAASPARASGNPGDDIIGP